MLQTVSTFMGALGMFLVGMSLLTDGLRLAAGPSLHRMLAAATRTRLQGLASGVAVTALVQSSSAVTVATLGFVNAGLLTLGGALWVLFGTNVGTTVTAWIVALIGLKFKIESLALPLIGLGALLHLTGSGARRGHLGSALAGFGLLFVGISMLQAAFSGAASQFELPGGSGPIAVLAQVAVGVVLTVFMQSSSAAMAVALTAASGGVLTLTSAAAVVIGANIGTTVTAVIASIGATPNAKRVALAHVAFNVLTACVALLMLPWLVDALSELARMIGINDDSATVLALFHTCFNVLGVLLIWPVADTLAQWLSRQFIQEENDATRPKFLDDTIKQVPTLAIDAMRQEIARAGDLASETIVAALQRTTEAELRRRLATVDAITKSIDEFAESMNRREMTRTSAEDLARLLRAERYIESITEALSATSVELEPMSLPHTVAQRYHDYAASAQAVLSSPTALAALQTNYQALKGALLTATAEGSLAVATMDRELRLASAIRRSIEQWTKAAAIFRPEVIA